MRSIAYFYRPKGLPEDGLRRLDFLTIDTYPSEGCFFKNTFTRFPTSEIHRLVREKILVKVETPIPLTAKEAILGIYKTGHLYTYTPTGNGNTKDREEVGYYDSGTGSFFQEKTSF